MSSMQHLGLTWPVLAERVERSGRWPAWVTAEPALASACGLQEVALIAADRARPGDADVLLGARGVGASVGTDPVTCFSDGEPCSGSLLEGLRDVLHAAPGFDLAVVGRAR